MPNGINATIQDSQVICKQPDRYIGWPTIARTSDDELIVVFSGDRDAHVCPWGKTQLVRSSDHGATWSDPATVNDTPLDDRDAGIIQTASGALVISWFTSLTFQENAAYADHASTLSAEVREQWFGSWTRRSTDGGATWEDPVRNNGRAPHGPIALRDGRLLFLGRGRDGDRVAITAEESTDDGRSWSLIGTVPLPPGASMEPLHEPHVVETPDGTLVGMVRCQGPDRTKCFLRQTESEDGGRTWSVLRETPVLGYPPHLTCLDDGTILVVFGRRVEPFGERACLSRDGGKTWLVDDQIETMGAINSDLGYPASVQLGDGSIFTVYYQIDQPGEKTCLMGTRWRLG